MFNKTVGIIHNSYLIKGGEDEVSKSEYQMLKQNNVKVHFLTFINPNIGYKAVSTFLFSLFNIVSFFKTYSWLRKNKINLLHIHNWFYKASPSIFWAAKILKVPIVITLHNYRILCPSGTLSYNGQPYLKSLQSNFPVDAIKKGVYRNSKSQTFWLVFSTWIHRIVGTWNIPKAYIVLTKNSLQIFEQSKRLFDLKKLIVKPNFIEDITQNKHLKKSDNFLYVGRLSQEKGISILLEAFAALPFQLTIIGDGPLIQQVKDYEAKFSNISYLGFQTKPVIMDALNAASALIFPSIWLETFGLTIIESFATGTPVIASNQGSASILVINEYNGLHFIPENIFDLQQTVIKWTNLTELEKGIYYVNARKSYVDNYTPEKNFNQLLAIYQKAVS